jgi:hypothetical protein
MKKLARGLGYILIGGGAFAFLGAFLGHKNLDALAITLLCFGGAYVLLTYGWSK